MQEKELKEILNKYLSGECSEDERALLETWYIEHEVHGLKPLSEIQFEEIEQSNIKVPKVKIPEKVNYKIARDWIAAAVVLSIFTFGIYFYQTKNKHDNSFKTELVGKDIQVGKNKAYLTLEDGSVIDLSSNQEGIIVNSENIKYKDGSTISPHIISTEQNKAVQNSNHINKVQMLALTTPNGGQYQVTLPDGTNVWLNSASSLKYPTHFTGNERRVELIGEGYFEVMENKKQPFVVQSAEQEIRVLGTQFNVNAYENENAIKTTLLEGSVQVLAYHSKSLNTQLLKPGQESFLKKGDDRFLINEIDAKKSIAWKEGYFRFDDMDIQSIMRAISRWYDIEIYYEGQMPNAKFIGRVSKFKNIHQVLTLLESTGEVNFKIESNLGSKGGRRIVVRK